MEVTLGPWTAEMSVDAALKTTLIDAVADEAKKVARANGFTSKDAGPGSPKGFSISGKITSVTKTGGTTVVKMMFNLWADGTMTNVPPVPGDGNATGSMTAEDVVRAIAEARVKRLLDAIKSGKAQKAR